MNWTKIPTDLLVARTPDIEILSIVKYQLLWAALERQPDDKTALRYLTPKQLSLAKEWHTPIMTQVVSDISSVEAHRKHQKINYNKNKDLSKNLTVSLLPSLPHSLTPSLQEVDKTRIDYIERESKEKVSGSDNAISKDTSLVPASASNQEDLFETDCSTYAGNISTNRKNSRSSRRASFVPPTKDEVREYAQTRGRLDLVDKFYDYFTAGKWHDSKGDQVKNWKQKFITWETHNPRNDNQPIKMLSAPSSFIELEDDNGKTAWYDTERKVFHYEIPLMNPDWSKWNGKYYVG